MKTLTKGLFGGALISAGLCSIAAADIVGTPEFSWINTAQTGAFAPFGTWDTHAGNGNFDVSDSSFAGFAQSMADQSGISLEARSDLTSDITFRGGSSDVATAFINTQFFVSEGTTVTVSWDFREMAGSFFSLSGTNGSFDTTGPSGSVQLNLVAGSNYNLSAQVTDTGSMFDTFSADASYVTMTINVVPLPTAAFAGLGMLAGLGAFRRIRK